jgi:RsiW-degrading membrane proteinase PrsW (M82 family)
MSLFWISTIAYTVIAVSVGSTIYYRERGYMDPLSAAVCGFLWPVVLLVTLVVLPGRIALAAKNKKREVR